MNEALARFAGDFAATVALYRGPLSFRLTIAASGAVEACDILVDRVLHLTPGDADWEPLRGSLVARLKALKFPAAAGRTVLIQPILFGTSAG